MRTREEIREAGRILRLNRRLSILKHYSGNIPFCACCGEKEIKFLCLDHINGGGTKHRQELQKSRIKPAGGSSVYSWIVKNNFPKGFQILCHNCNMAKGCYGVCPHNNKN